MTSTRRAAVSHAQQERLRQEDRRIEFTREQNVQKLQQDSLIIANAKSDNRVDTKRRLRHFAEENREIELLESLEQESARRLSLETQRAQEEALAQELDALRISAIRDQKMRQQVRDNSVELRELERKLKLAYQSKELGAQMMEHQVTAQTTRQLDATTARIMDQAREQAEREEEEERQRHWERNKHNQAELDRQLQDQERQKQQAYEEFLKEKMMIDEIVNKIYDEDRVATEREMNRKVKTRRELDDFKIQQEAFRQREHEQMEKENMKLMEHAHDMEERDQAVKAQRQERHAATEEIQSRIAAKVLRERSEREEMERIREELYEEEIAERDRIRDKAAIETRLRQRLDLQRGMAEDLSVKQEQRQREGEEEEAFRVSMMEKFAREDRLEQMNAQKKRMKQLDHKRAVETLIEERRQRAQLEKAREKQALAAEASQEQARRTIIEQERQRLLREHATKLLGYLPKGVIRDAADLEFLGDDFQQTYRPSTREEEY